MTHFIAVQLHNIQASIFVLQATTKLQNMQNFVESERHTESVLGVVCKVKHIGALTMR